MGRINRAEFIHQLWDTRDDFNGGSSCGPTSAVIDLVTYQLPNQFGVQVSSPQSHFSKWGRYITDEFSNRGTTFNRAQNDWTRTGSFEGRTRLDHRLPLRRQPGPPLRLVGVRA